MFRTKDNRRLFVIGLVTIILSIMSLLNNIINIDAEIWISISALGLSLLLFLWAYLVDHETYAAIGAYVLTAIIGLLVLTTWFSFAEAIVPSYVLNAVGLPFLIVWLDNRQNWGMLIPAYTLAAITPILFITKTVKPELLPAYVLTVIGLPFLLAYFVTRKKGWLVPSGILFIVAASFVGIAFGIPAAFISISLPVLALVLGAAFVWQAAKQQPEEKQKI
jgi:hypothetical protein